MDILKRIDELIDSSRQDVAELTKTLVNIKSEQTEALPGAPFGEGVRRVLEKVMELGEKEGFYPIDYNVGVVSVALKNSHPDLGIWVHGDVVPAGSGWSFEPYNAVEYEGRIVGRGAADNKGQLAAMFILLGIFKKLGIELKYNPALFVGSNEETGMFDIIGEEGNEDTKGFINVCTPPRLSLVPDGAFPVGYGGKGNVTVKLKTKMKLDNIQIIAGQPSAPGKAVVTVKGKKVAGEFAHCTVTRGEHTAIEAFSQPVHTAHPDPMGNMITAVSKAMLETDVLSNDVRKIFEFLEMISTDTEGKCFDINVETQTMTPLTLAAYRIDDLDGCAEVYVNIRYPVEITLEKLLKNIGSVSEEYGFEIDSFNSIHKPYLLDKDTELVKTLCRISNSVTGDDKQPYTLGGGTYAHELPNAYVFGSSANLRPEGWEKGRGGAHGIDEVVSLDRLQRAMRIYARALLALNDMEW